MAKNRSKTFKVCFQTRGGAEVGYLHVAMPTTGSWEQPRGWTNSLWNQRWFNSAVHARLFKHTHAHTHVIAELILMQRPEATGLRWWLTNNVLVGEKTSTGWRESVWQCRTWKHQGLFKRKHEISLLLKCTVCLKMGLSQTQAVWKRLMQEWSRRWESSEKRWWETENDPQEEKNTHGESVRNKWREHKVVIQGKKKKREKHEEREWRPLVAQGQCCMRSKPHTQRRLTSVYLTAQKQNNNKKAISHMYGCSLAFPINLAINPERPDI